MKDFANSTLFAWECPFWKIIFKDTIDQDEADPFVAPIMQYTKMTYQAQIAGAETMKGSICFPVALGHKNHLQKY